MFGCCVAGRLLQTNIQQVDETHAIFELPAASKINHISVFLLGTVLFPDGYGATVHFHWPGKGFQLLGMLSNEKPSAIFRVRGYFTGTSSLQHAAFAGASDTSMDASGDVTAILGFSIEPLDQIASQIASVPKPSVANNPTFLAERVVKHLINYITSFVMDGGGAMNAQAMVPVNLIMRWYENFQGKLRAGGVGFLERDES